MLFHLLTYRNCLSWLACVDSACQVINKIMFNTPNILWYKFLAQHKCRSFVCGRFLMHSPALIPFNSCVYDMLYLQIFITPYLNAKKMQLQISQFAHHGPLLHWILLAGVWVFGLQNATTVSQWFLCMPYIPKHKVGFLFKEQYSYKDKIKPSWNIIFLGNFISLCRHESVM